MDKFPLIPAQYFLYRLATEVGPAGPFLHVVTSVQIKGPVDVDRFEQAAAQLPEFHPLLSATIGIVDQRPVQFYDEKRVSFEVVRAAKDSKEVDAIFSDRADRPFDIFNDGLLRIVLALTDNGEAFLLLVGHHIFFDITALRIIFHDYLQLCSAPSPGSALPLSEHPGITFFSYVSLEAEMLRDGTYDRKMEYWQNLLSRADPELHLVEQQAGQPRTPQSQRSIPFRLDSGTFERFSERVRLLRVTPFTVASSAMFEALRRHTSQEELLLGVVADARRPPFDRTVGNYTGMFLLRQGQEERGMTDSAIRRNFKNIMQASMNYVPNRYFMDRISWVQRRVTSGVAMCDAYMDFLPASTYSQSGFGANGDIEIERFPLHFRTQAFDQPYNNWVIGMILIPGERGLWGKMEYESALLSEDTASKILASWMEALAK